MSSFLYHYDSREHHQPLNRQKRFAAFLFVMCALTFALNIPYLWEEDWSGENQTGWGYWHIVLAALGLVFAIYLIALLVSKNSKIGYADYQYLNVTDTGIEWLLNKRKGPQSIDFADIKYALQDPRHLILKKQDGEEVWLENYLIEDEELKWTEFIEAVRAKVEMK